VSVNAPAAGTIKELLVKEEDTVTVGQDLVRLELGGEGAGGKEAASKEDTGNAAQEQKPAAQEEEKPNRSLRSNQSPSLERPSSPRNKSPLQVSEAGKSAA
jgi:2-oxoglutarate dehydrogenase E2 component (dihydrolipoamide succinyltransferase)